MNPWETLAEIPSLGGVWNTDVEGRVSEHKDITL